LAAGIPLIGMLDGDGRRVIDEAAAGLTGPAGNASRLAEMVTALAELPEGERVAMGERGRAYAAKEFDRDRLILALEERLMALSQRRVSR